MQVTGSNKIRTLQLLRAVAVLLVAYAHIIDIQPGNGTWPLQAHFYYLQNVGAVGVDIFFVISGFIIAIISQQYANTGQPGLFLLKRLVRIVPVYWLVTICLVVHAYLSGHGSFAPRNILKTLVFFPFFDKDQFAAPILYVGWTLSFEIYFYVVVAACMKVSPKRYLLLTVLFLLGCVTIVYLLTPRNMMLVTAGNPIILEFLLGVFAGIIYQHKEKIHPGIFWAMLAVGAGWLLATVFTGYEDISEAPLIVNGEQSVLRVLLWGIPAALLVAGAVMLEKKRKLSAGPLWVHIGDASYSIYLVHTLFLTAIYRALERWGIVTTIPPDLLIVIMLFACPATGYLFYRAVEKPLLHWLQRQLFKRKKGI